jgi:hypothetical protein
MENPETLATCGHMTQIEDKQTKKQKKQKNTTQKTYTMTNTDPILFTGNEYMCSRFF